MREMGADGQQDRVEDSSGQSSHEFRWDEEKVWIACPTAELEKALPRVRRGLMLAEGGKVIAFEEGLPG
jgi:hypothetical protein